jgi:ATP-dependent RNA helicase DDX31/DBP7
MLLELQSGEAVSLNCLLTCWLALLPAIVHQAAQPKIQRADGTYAVILAPTRELALQISDVLTALLRRFCWLVGGLLIGGENRGHEKARLRKGVTVVVATPGRIIDHLEVGYVPGGWGAGS